ncbi:MAG: IS66 family transposase [Thermoleophilaceae bacterium]
MAEQQGAQRLEPTALAGLETRYGRIIAAGHEQNPPPAERSGARGPIARSKSANLLRRLDGQRDEVLRFAHDFRVPFSNNQAERDIRMVKAAAEDLRLLAHQRGRRAVPSDPLLPLDRPQAGAPSARAARPAHRRPAVAARARAGLTNFDPHRPRCLKPR